MIPSQTSNLTDRQIFLLGEVIDRFPVALHSEHFARQIGQRQDAALAGRTVTLIAGKPAGTGALKAAVWTRGREPVHGLFRL